MSRLSDVKGGFSAQSEEAFDCKPFNEAHDRGVMKGTYFCSSDSAITSFAPTSAATASSGTHTSEVTPSSTSTSPRGREDVSGGVIGGIVAGATVVVILIIALVVRYRQSKPRGDSQKEGNIDEVLEVPPGVHHGKAELVGSNPSYQMAELYGDSKQPVQLDHEMGTFSPPQPPYLDSPVDSHSFVSPISPWSSTFGTNFPDRSQTNISELEGSSISELNGTPVTPKAPADLV